MSLFSKISERVLGAVLDRAPWMLARLAAEKHLETLLSVVSSRFRLRLVEFSPPLGASLACGDAPLRLRFDSVILPAVLRTGAWQASEVRSIAGLLDRRRRYVLVDVGANAGLISRQALTHIPQIIGAYCFEPDPINFSCLEFNLRSFPGVVANNIALGERDGRMEFFLDKSNSGNFSLSEAAMEGCDFSKTEVEVRAVSRVFEGLHEAVDSSLRILYKSDTQGFDEYIAAHAPATFWARVDIVVMELWRMRKPDFDRERFRDMLGNFPNRRLGQSDRPVTVDDVMAFAAGPQDNTYADLILWR